LMLLSPIKHKYTKLELNLAEYWDIQLLKPSCAVSDGGN
jgi:hypothetical protein